MNNIEKNKILEYLKMDENTFLNTFWYSIDKFIEEWDINTIIGIWFSSLI